MDKNDLPTVSVVIPVFNAGRFLERAVLSALAQDGVCLSEIVIVDDKSNGETLDVIAELQAKHPVILAVHNSENRGPGYSRNVGIAHSSGDWIALLDADDAFLPNRLERLIMEAEKNELEAISDLPLFYDLAADAYDSNQLGANGNLDTLHINDLFEPDPETGLDMGLMKPVFLRRLSRDGIYKYDEGERHAQDFLLYVSLLASGVKMGLLREAMYVFSTRIGGISGKFSPGSVTRVHYRNVARQNDRIAADLAARGIMTGELRKLLASRRKRSLLANRRYGWNVLRHGEYSRLWKWLLQDPRNIFVLFWIAVKKLFGHRGLPD